jgi:Tol biopolymer transport system component
VNAYVTPRISPDGKMLAVQIFNAGSEDMWIYDFSRNTLMRLTFSGGGGSAAPLWTPDGRKVLYRSRVPSLSFRSKPADGSGAEETLFSKELEDPGATPFTVSPDGKTLLFGRNVTGAVGIYSISLDGSAKVQPFLQSTFNQSSPRFSPDGHWVVYASNESGREEIYVQPYPGPGGKWLISAEGGAYPIWARSGREIFFRSEDKIMVVPVETQPTFKAGTPRMLFQSANYLRLANYDVAPDGQHFLMIKEKEAPASSKEVSIVLHWTDELKRRVPSAGK